MSTANEGPGSQYAEAILELALDGQVDEAVLMDLSLINSLLNSTEELPVIFNHPAIQPEKKKEFLVALFKGKVNELTMRLLELLADRRRLALLPAIEFAYRKALHARKNIVSAKLVSAEKLDEATVANIRGRLAKQFGKQLELEVKVDKALIGGVVLRLGDQVIDGSVRGKLKAMERALLTV